MKNPPFDLRTHDLQKRFDGFTLGPISLEVPHGTVVGLVGQNGAGKTTLMKLVLGSLHPSSGSIELFGQGATHADEATSLTLHARVGYVASECAYPSGMTVSNVVRMHELSYPRFDRDAYRDVARRLEFDAPTRKVSELSRGMGMKLQLACMLAAQVDLLVLDEPTAGLDPVVRQQALDALRTWMEQGDHSILISSHITSDLQGFADYLTLVHEGRVALATDVEQILSMGIARLRADELERVRADHALGTSGMRLLRRDLSCELLVPNRHEFCLRYPHFVCDPASIDDVLMFIVKGEEI